MPQAQTTTALSEWNRVSINQISQDGLFKFWSLCHQLRGHCCFAGFLTPGLMSTQRKKSKIPTRATRPEVHGSEFAFVKDHIFRIDLGRVEDDKFSVGANRGLVMAERMPP